MPDLVHRIIAAVTAEAQGIHGRYSGRETYQAALAANLRFRGVPLQTGVTASEYFDDVEIIHCLDLVIFEQVGVAIRTAQEASPDQYSAKAIESLLGSVGLRYGLVVDFSQRRLQITQVSLPHVPAYSI
jgi:hypothetical protein